MRRIIILGSTGAGKSTLASRLAAKLSLPVIEMDDIHWLPNWTFRDEAEARALTDTATRGDKWVLCGNYRYLRDIYWGRADTVVWLDYPFHLCFWRLLLRSIGRAADKRLICNGNHETWGKLFSKDSIMIWLFKSYWRRKKEFGEIFDNPARHPHLTLRRLTSPGAAEDFLNKA